MTYKANLLASVALVATTFPALADVTAQDVWTSWQDLSSSMGQTMNAGSETMEGDTLVVSDIEIMFEPEDSDATASSTIDEIRFTENGDGTVSIEMSPSYDVTSVAEVDGETQSVTMTIEQSNMVTLASGTPDQIDYDLTADAIRISGAIPDDDEMANGMIEFALTDLQGTYNTDMGAMVVMGIDGTAGEFAFSVTGTDPETDALTDVSMSAADVQLALNYEASADGPNPSSSTDMQEILASGFAFDMKATHGEASSTVVAEGEEGINLNIAAASGTFDFAFAQDGLSYAASNDSVAITASGPSVPFPEVNADLETLALSFEMPVEQGGEAQPFGAVIELGGLTISDMIWGIFDPEGKIPRDPATLLVDVSGQARWLVDIFDDEEEMDDQPGEVESLELNELNLALGGAELTGTGAFTFDNSDYETFEGIPAPDGQIDLQLTGGNTLLGILVEMGFVPQDQAMMVRMMSGMFAQPGEGEDTLVSTIRVEPDGSVFANDTQLQ